MAAPVSKKRKTREDDLTFVELPRDQLLTMSSMQLEDNIRSLTAIRSLTGPEQREIKRQRRLVKNREYAQTSRVKKKQFMDELRQENDVLRDRLRLLEEENHYLRFGGSAPQPHLQQFVPRSAQPQMQLEHLVNVMPPHNQNFIAAYPSSYQEDPQRCQDLYQNQQQMVYSSSTSPQLAHTSPSYHSSVSTPGTPQSYPESPVYLPTNSSSSAEHSSEEAEVFEYDSDDFFFPPLEDQTVPQMHNTHFGSSFAGSLCLMVVLFSFAIFLPNFLTPFGNPFALTHPVKNGPSFVVEPNAEVFRTSRILLSSSDIPSQTTIFQPNDTTNSQSNYGPVSLSSVFEEEATYALNEQVKAGPNGFQISPSA